MCSRSSYLVHWEIAVETVVSFLDLETVLDSKLQFDLHIPSCVNKAKVMLGFVKRRAKEFDDPTNKQTTSQLHVLFIPPLVLMRRYYLSKKLLENANIEKVILKIFRHLNRLFGNYMRLSDYTFSSQQTILFFYYRN